MYHLYFISIWVGRFPCISESTAHKGKLSTLSADPLLLRGLLWLSRSGIKAGTRARFGAARLMAAAALGQLLLQGEARGACCTALHGGWLSGGGVDRRKGGAQGGLRGRVRHGRWPHSRWSDRGGSCMLVGQLRVTWQDSPTSSTPSEHLILPSLPCPVVPGELNGAQQAAICGAESGVASALVDLTTLALPPPPTSAASAASGGGPGSRGAEPGAQPKRKGQATSAVEVQVRAASSP